MEILFNGKLSIEVSAHGAELCSIFSNGKEYLWQADPAFWKRHSPVLFPIVGSVWENEYRNEGTTYALTQHGFARDMEFTLILEHDDEVRYQLVSNEETLKKYPFPFCLEIGYRIHGKKIDVTWEVKNTGEKEMHFQIGAHPAFYFPEFDAATKDRGFFVFDRKSDLEYIMPTEKGCVSPERHVLKLNKEGLMPIDIHTFDCDTYIFDNKQLKKITLLDKKKKPHISLEFNSPLVALWSPTKTHPDCPFVCIEPWYGRCDSVGYSGELKDREWIQKLEPKETFDVEYKIIIE